MRVNSLSASLLPAVLFCVLIACAGNGADAPRTVPVSAASPAPASASSPAPAAEQDSASAADAESAESEETGESEEPVYSNSIRWATASEVDNFGFDVYRAESEEGPFTLLTKKPIEGGGTVDEPQQYLFVDDTIDPAATYYYYVESISMSGGRERFTPVVKAKPKVPSSPAGDS